MPAGLSRASRPGALILCALALCSSVGCRRSAGPALPEETRASILFDNIHSRKQNPLIKLGKDRTDYEHSHGYSRLLACLEASGVQCDSVGDGSLTAERLAPYDLLFVGLADSTRPAYTPEEIEAVRGYVESGGSLYVVTEHTNAWYHADVVNPLLECFGIRATYNTATEMNPENQLDGRGWHKGTRFEPDPLTQGLSMIALATPGALEVTGGARVLARSSADSFADWWDESAGEGHHGNLDRDEGEPGGPLCLAVVADRGDGGKVAVLADMNIFGDMWLNYADNWAFAARLFGWLLDDKVTIRRDDRYDILVDESHNGALSGRCTPPEAYRAFYVNLNRDQRVAAHGGYALDGEWDAVWLIAPSVGFSAEELAWLDGHLAQGRPVLGTLDETRVSPAARALLEHLGIACPDDAPQGAYSEERLPLRGPGTDSTDRVLSSCRPAPEWGGEPWLWVERGVERYDVARRAVTSSGGEVIVFVQSRFWRTEFLGGVYADPDAARGDAWELEWLLLDHLTGVAEPTAAHVGSEP